MKTEKPEKPDNHVDLIYIIQGEEEKVDKVNVHQPLKVSAQKALEQSGNTGRPLSDYIAKYGNQDIDLSKNAQDYNLPDGAKIYLTLKSGQGGA